MLNEDIKKIIQETEEKKKKAHDNFLSKHSPLKMKPYSNNVPVNEIIDVINKKVPKGLKNAAKAVYFSLEAHANKACYANPAQATIASECDMSREYVCYILKKLDEAGIIKKIRRGLTYCNIYILVIKQKLMEDLQSEIELNITLATLKKQLNKTKNNKIQTKENKKSTFNNYNQRKYNFENLEGLLLGNIEYYDGALQEYTLTEIMPETI